MTFRGTLALEYRLDVADDALVSRPLRLGLLRLRIAGLRPRRTRRDRCLMSAHGAPCVGLGDNDFSEFFEDVLAELVIVVDVGIFSELLHVFGSNLDLCRLQVGSDGDGHRYFRKYGERATLDITAVITDFLDLELEAVCP